jgi:WD40 repeat protein
MTPDDTCARSEVRLLNAKTGQSLRTITLPVGRDIATATFSPDSKDLAIGSCAKGQHLTCTQSEVRLLSIDTGQMLGSPLSGPLSDGQGDIPDATLTQIVYSPQGAFIAGISGQAMTRGLVLWNSATHQSINLPISAYVASGWRVTSAVFSPDGVSLVLGICETAVYSGRACGQQGLQMWDMRSLRPIGPLFTGPGNLAGTLDAINTLAYTPDGASIVVVDAGSPPLSVWDVGVESWQEQACRIANRNLTRSEWEQYMGQEPYQKTCPNLPTPG